MSSDYSVNVSLDITGGLLVSMTTERGTHTITLTPDERGIRQLHELLRCRKRLGDTKARLGTPAAPFAYDLDKVRRFSPGNNGKEIATKLEDLDL